ncbi:MAG TPA: recombinase family protein [Herpetosiphonaceae bacterium]|nr:recombinase family protein [Herpetosiphonaceae bacterium]
MIALEARDSGIGAQRLARLAYVYIRQSSPGQVLRNTESTDLQYRLVERAVNLGWPRERVTIIDEDLGKSGASAEGRLGFQHLIAEIGLARVGLVVSMDASRLARNNHDWYQLLDLCSIFGTLIADGERLYDPSTYHDRLLLGLSGMMSEAELYQLKQRLYQGELHKAERGELRLPLPVGLVRVGGEVVQHPDEEVRARIELVFDKFTELKSAKAVMRYLQSVGLPLPSRPLRGPAPHQVAWETATSSRVLQILKNPAYAGAYVYGRQTRDPTRRKPGHPHSGIIRRPIDSWLVCLQNVHPAYIPWETFLANQERLRDNQSRYEEGQHGVPRKGQALLQGIVVCGRCGRHMGLRYSGPSGEYPVYVCNADQQQYGGKRCQEARGLAIDTEIERLLLEALLPDRIELALAALESCERETEELGHQWSLRVERARYEAERARRQYDAVEPENRLVARSLERCWEGKLRLVEQVERERSEWADQRAVVTPQDRELILELGEDLPAVWHASTTTAADRKQILRLIIKEVIVDGHRVRGQVWFRINWRTGATSEHHLMRNVISYDEYSELEALQERVRELNAQGLMDSEIAARLDEEGFRTARGRTFSSELVWELRKRWGVPTVKVNGKECNPTRWEDGTYSVEGAAEIIGVTKGTIYHWLLAARIQGRQLAKGMPWQIPLHENQIEALRDHVRRARRSKREAS